jgi:hypothetical protein
LFKSELTASPEVTLMNISRELAIACGYACPQIARAV